MDKKMFTTRTMSLFLGHHMGCPRWAMTDEEQRLEVKKHCCCDKIAIGECDTAKHVSCWKTMIRRGSARFWLT